MKETINKDWEANLDNEKNVPLDALKFIFAQAEKRLDDGIKNYDATTTKSISFITLTATLLTALTAYFFINFDPSGQFSQKLFTVMVCCIYTFFILYRFVSIILPKSYQPMGSYPQDLYVNTMFTDELKAINEPKDYILFNFYLAELENYNCRIAENAEANEARLKLFNESAFRVCMLPLVGIAVYFLLLLLSSDPSF